MSDPAPHNNPRDPVAAPGADTSTGTGCDTAASEARNNRGGVGAGAVPARRRRRRFSSEALTKLQAARLWILLNRPYYCRALFACPLIPTDAAPTMSIAMDRRWRIFVNPHYVESNTVEKVAAVLIHEINHALRAHAERGEQTAAPHLMAYWKAACDLEINDDLQDDDLDVDDGLLPERFDLEPYQTAERYYQQLIDKTAALGEIPDCGPVCGAHPNPDQFDPDSEEGLSDLQRWMIRQGTARTLLEHDDDWDLPEGLRDWAQQATGAKADWRQILARALRRSLHLHTGASDYTWQRPPRRYDPDDPVLRPALTAPTGDIAVVLDTSGSMDQDDHAQAFGEIDAILHKAVPGQAIRVLSVDDTVHSNQRVNHTREITPLGGRGTDMAAGIEAAAECAPAAIVVITDGYTPWPPAPPPGARCVIAALTQNDMRHRVPGWIQAIDISQNP